MSSSDDDDEQQELGKALKEKREKKSRSAKKDIGQRRRIAVAERPRALADLAGCKDEKRLVAQLEQIHSTLPKNSAYARHKAKVLDRALELLVLRWALHVCLLTLMASAAAMHAAPFACNSQLQHIACTMANGIHWPASHLASQQHTPSILVCVSGLQLALSACMHARPAVGLFAPLHLASRAALSRAHTSACICSVHRAAPHTCSEPCTLQQHAYNSPVLMQPVC